MNAVRAEENEVFSSKKRSASRKATQSTCANKLVKRRRATSMTGGNKRSSTLRQTRICTTMQNALPKAVGGNLRGTCNWMHRGGQGWDHKSAVETTYLCIRHSLKGRPTQVAKRNELPARSRKDDKKRAEHADRICWNIFSVQPAQLPQHVKHKCDASRSLLGAQHNLLARLFESAGDTSRLRLRPAHLRWSHCS